MSAMSVCLVLLLLASCLDLVSNQDQEDGVTVQDEQDEVQEQCQDDVRRQENQEHLQELLGLSELPLDRLLNVKHSLDLDAAAESASVNDVPQALPLTGSKPPSPPRRGDHVESGWDSDKKSSSITSIFSTTVTALAFIAFAAYLLAMVIIAIQNNTGNNNVTGTAANLVVQQAPIVSGRRRREAGGMWLGADTQGMYQALVMLSEGYAMYHKAGIKRG